METSRIYLCDWHNGESFPHPRGHYKGMGLAGTERLDRLATTEDPFEPYLS